MKLANLVAEIARGALDLFRRRGPGMDVKSDVKIWKLLGAIVLVSVFVIFSPNILYQLHLINSVKDHAWWITTIATIGMIVKIICGDLIAGEFLYYKHGYDSCILTFGAALSNLSLQLLSPKDEFPNISPNGLLDLSAFSSDEVIQKRILLLAVFLLALVGSLLTAYIAKAISQPKTQFKSTLSVINFSIGAGLLATYLLMLLAKGH
jgi:hypothetical protein